MKGIRWVFLALWFSSWAAAAPAPEPVAEELPPWFKASLLDLRDDLAEARHGGKGLLLFFYQEGCPYCARMLADNFGQKPIADKTREAFDVVAIDVRGMREVTDPRGTTTTERRFAEGMRVLFTPTLLFLDGQGRTVVRLNGYYPPHRFDRALDYASGRAGEGMTFSDYMRGVKPQPAAGRLQGESWFLPPPHDLTRFAGNGAPPLAVLFEQQECGACDDLHRDLLETEETRRQLAGFAVVQLDMRAATPVVTPTGEVMTARDWARRLGVEYAPTLLFFDAAGRETFRIDSWLEPALARAGLDYMATGAWRNQTFPRFLKARGGQAAVQ